MIHPDDAIMWGFMVLHMMRVHMTKKTSNEAFTLIGLAVVVAYIGASALKTSKEKYFDIDDGSED